MSRYDFNVVACCYTPNGGILRSAAIHWAVAPSEHEARAVIIRGIVDAGGWVQSIKRVTTPSPWQAEDVEYSRYNIQMVIRDEAEYRGGKEVKHNCTASNEQEARRDALERAWASGCLVTKFTKIKTKDLP